MKSNLLLVAGLAALVTALRAGETQHGETPTGDRKLESIERTYLQNRQLFSAFSCRFRVREGRAHDRADALAGRLEKVVSQSGLWICDDADGRYELLCDQEPRLQPPVPSGSGGNPPIPGGVMTEIPCLSIIELYSGDAQRRVGLSRLFDNATLEEGGRFSAVVTPLSLGVMGRGEQYSPAEVIRESRKEGRVFCRYAGSELVDGVTVEKVEFDFNHVPNSAPYLTWYLDTLRGCLPLKTVYARGNETVATGIRQCDNGGYICERAVTMDPFSNGMRVTIMELVNLDLSRPPRESLALSLSPGTTVADRSDLRSAFRLRNAEVLRLDDFEMWKERCRTVLKN